MLKPVTLPKVKGFESEIDEPTKPIAELVREALLGSRRHPETIYVVNKASIPKVEEILVALHGLRGQRTPVLHDPDLRRPFEIRWGL